MLSRRKRVDLGKGAFEREYRVMLPEKDLPNRFQKMPFSAGKYFSDKPFVDSQRKVVLILCTVNQCFAAGFFQAQTARSIIGNCLHFTRLNLQHQNILSHEPAK